MRNTVIFVKKRLKRVIVPFLIISIFFIILENLRNYGGISFSTFIKEFLYIFIGYNPAYQLWYIPMYLFVVLTYPLIKNLIKNSNVRICIFGFISLIYILLANYTNLFQGYVYPFSFVYYFLFFEIGCFVSRNNLNKYKQWSLFCVYIVFFIICLLTKDYSFNAVIYNIVLAPLAVWVFYYISIQLKENFILNTLGKYSFYIFLFHDPIFVRWLSRQINERHLYNGYYMTLLLAIFAIFASILLYKFLSKIGLSQLIFAEKNTLIRN